ncbi:uncharacterized protein LOC119672241 [Teleopsis dalmanni]|uniref:uncharacterized protein LOC119672241 n=1 Tax=Teleopsis dalmanni TaxID=139649 RepID=UPI0018CEF4DA|nr:uncharacterized protein LOC119672241 [Teleopsis dalmanni]
MSEEIWDKIEERRLTKAKMLGEADITRRQVLNRKYEALNKVITKRAKEDKKNFYDALASEAEKAANNTDMKTLFAVTRTLSGQKNNARNIPVEDENGVLVNLKQEQLLVWKKYFESTLNSVFATTEDNLTSQRRHNINRQINTEPPTVMEISSAISSLKKDNSPSSDGLAVECFQLDPQLMATKLLSIFNKLWLTESITLSWKESVIVKILKKGDQKICSNWRASYFFLP